MAEKLKQKVLKFFQRRPDPISGRSREVEAEIVRLERQIKRLSQQEAEHVPFQRSDHGAGTPLAPTRGEPIFEDAGPAAFTVTGAKPAPQLYNEQGVRKYDLVALWQRMRARFSGNHDANRKLISYLAAGSIQGLRPLRYEKRVARNRALLFAGILFVIVLGIAALLTRA